MKVAKYGEACESSSHVCLQNSACINGFCSCPAGRKLDAFGVCSTDLEVNKRILDLKVLKPLHDTTLHQNVSTDHGTNHTAAGGTYSLPGEGCADGQQCLGGSICDNDVRKCICAAGHQINRGTCVDRRNAQISNISVQCNEDRQCTSGARCKRGLCMCNQQKSEHHNLCRYISNITGPQLHDNGTLRFSSRKQEFKRVLAAECPLPEDPELCQLPDCFCSKNGNKPPGGLDVAATPQFIVLTFDDAVNGKTVPDYRELFEISDFRNANGCPIQATVFVSHEWTNYDAVERLHWQGHEIASNSITHETLTRTSPERWLNEMAGQRHILTQLGNVPEEDIRGIRAPQIAAGGDEQFEMMEEAGFLYDNTLIADPGRDEEPYWPQTLDYRLSWPCSDDNCPQSSFPGVWEIPINLFYGQQNDGSSKRSAMLRGAVQLNFTAEEIYNLLVDNFERAYYTNRAPYLLTLNADFLQLNDGKAAMQALKSFLDAALTNPDVYTVSIRQLIEWMRDPKPLTEISQSKALQCNSNRGKVGCDVPNKCIYRTKELASPEHQFLTCNPCPSVYPWLENPSGSIEEH